MSRIHITGFLEAEQNNSSRGDTPWKNGLYFIGMKTMDYGPARFRVHAVRMHDGICTTERMNDDPVSIPFFAQLIKTFGEKHENIEVLLTGGFQKQLREVVELISQGKSFIVFDHETICIGKFPNWRQL